MGDTPTTELLATCWTSAGDVRPGLTPDESPVAFEDRVAAVAEAGFTGIGLELADLESVRRSRGLSSARTLIADHGLTHVEVEFLNDWWLDGDRRADSDPRRRRLLDAATALGAHPMKLGSGQPGDDHASGRLIDELGRLGTEAREAGTRLAVETGAGSGLDLVDDVLPAVVALADPHVGLMLDPWHFVRSGTPYDVITGIAASAITAVEISDGAATAIGSFFGDTFDRRLLPGDGAFDVSAFVSAVRGTGWTGAWGVEVMSDVLRALPVPVVLQRAFTAATRVLGAETGSP
ncbi:sugar phosphate isomerase/epimerase family protein [Frondihabitans australicus]|uniref:Sugar phosphate isomerase/epimerase n=1 Tax=Frondihabitans australicus TaxID=386892 RepID=A0A495IHQ3_9MICO|nr:sugar phosphate isomerase/epimerase [Frondihabitans australicus]RKR74841.1 sugar phosphate isomerase/epimerase [Frondihabitans australicus]